MKLSRERIPTKEEGVESEKEAIRRRDLVEHYASLLTNKIIDKLRDPEIPNAKKGLEGIKEANKILQDKKSKGILIGGLVKDIWNKENALDDLNKHKDIDVLVLNQDFNLSHNFEGGIDWWLPQEKIYINNFGDESKTQFWENGYGIVLGFEPIFEQSLQESPRYGLYLPDKSFFLEMKLAEMKTLLNYEHYLLGKLGGYEWEKKHAREKMTDLENLMKITKDGERLLNLTEEYKSLKEIFQKNNSEFEKILAKKKQLENQFFPDMAETDIEELRRELFYDQEKEVLLSFAEKIKTNSIMGDISQFFEKRILSGEKYNKEHISAESFDEEIYNQIMENK